MEASLRWRVADAQAGVISHYHVYRGTQPDFKPGLLNLVQRPSGLACVDRPQLHYGGWIDRLMAGYRLRAGLEPKAKGYGGWDSVEGKQLTGHIGGHYLSAVSLMYAATGDPRFKERADYLVKELKEVQDRRGNGYLGALADQQGTDGAAIFERVSNGDIRSGGFDLNGLWSPWYTLHKTYAGLRDAYRFTGNQTALELETKFAAWAEHIMAKLSDAQVQRMLNTEFGGMNEIFVDLYADTGDRRWLDLSRKFEHRAITEPLMRHQDRLGGQHGNTQVPKLIDRQQIPPRS